MTMKLTKKLRSVIALVLAFCMTLGTVGTSLAKEPTGEAEIKYVSLGDSMSNGYGLPGYELNSGVETYGHVAYANQFADWLESEGYADHVDHAQLAMSGIRAEDLHWLLELDYNDQEAIDLIQELIDGDWNEEKWNAKFSTGDYWTLEEICDHARLDATYLAIVGGQNYDYPSDPYKYFERKLDADFEYPATYNELADMSYGENRAMKVALVAKYFQDSVAEADIVSLAVGNGNLGVFGFGRILELIGFTDSVVGTGVYRIESAIRELDPAMQAEFLALKARLYDVVKAEMGMDIESNDTLKALAEVVVYIGLSLVLNYAGSIEAVLQLNPDAEIMMVPIMNTFAEANEAVEGVTIGDLMNAIVVPMNAFLAALPTYMQAVENNVYADATFYYAESTFVECMVDTYEEAMKKDDNIVRDRFITEIVGDKNTTFTVKIDESNKITVPVPNGIIFKMVGPMFYGLVGNYGLKLELVKRADVEAYEAFAEKWNAYMAGEIEEEPSVALTDGQILSCAVYLAFEQAVIEATRSSSITMDSFAALAGGLDSLFGDIASALDPDVIVDMDKISAAVMAALTPEVMTEISASLMADPEVQVYAVTRQAVYEGVMTKAALEGPAALSDEEKAMYDAVMEAASESGDIYSAVKGIVTAEVMAEFSGKLFDAVLANDTAKVTVAKYAARFAAAGITSPLASALTSNPILVDLLSLFGRCMIGNGLGAHPSEAGHNALAASVIDAYANEHTAKDETIENLKVAAQIAADLVAEYYDEAYAYAYAEAKNAGYIDAAVAAIEDVKTTLAAIDVNAIVVEGTTEAFKAELQNAINEAITALTKAQALIVEADMLDQATLDALMALLDQAGEASWRAVELLEQATLDAGHLAVDPALKAAHDKAVEAHNKLVADVKAAIENLKAAVQAGTEYLLEKIGEAYNTFVEAVTKAVSEAVELIPNAAEVADWIYDYLYNNPDKVIAFFNEYGDEIGAFFGEYGDEIVVLMAWLAYTYGEDVAAYIIDHADEIIPVMIDWIEEHGANAWALIMVYVDELGLLDHLPTTEELMDALNAAMAMLGELIAQYAEDAYEYAYQYAQEQGYIDAFIDAIDDIIEQLKNIDLGIEGLTDAMKQEIAKQIGAIIEMLEAVKDLILSADKLDDALMDAVQDLLDQAAEALAQVMDLLKQAGVDLNNQVLSALQAAHDALVKGLCDAVADLKAAVQVGIDCLMEKLGDAYDTFVEALTAVIRNAADMIPNAAEVADWIYNYLYNNPDQVIGFFEEFGDEIADLIKEFGDEAVMLLGWLAYNYGEEVLEYIVANADEIIPAMIDWLEEHGANAWALIMVYIEELGLLDELPTTEELMGAVNEALAALGKLLEEYGEELLDNAYAYLQAQDYIGLLNDAIDALKAELAQRTEDFINNIKPQIEAAIKALEAKLECLLQQLEDLKAELEEKKAELEQMIGEGVEEAIKELEKIIAEIEAAIEAVEQMIAEIEDAIAQLKAAIEKMEQQLAELAEKIAALEKAVKDLYDAVINAAEDGYQAVVDAYEAAKKAVEDAVAFVEKVYDEIAETLEQIAGLIDWIEDAVEALNDYVEDFLACLIKKAECLLDCVKDAAEAAIEKALEELLAAVERQIKIAAGEILDMIGEALKPYVEALNDAVIALGEQIVDGLEDLVDMVVEAFEDAYERATSDRYDITCKSYYVAIGDISAKADSYVELLKDEMTGLKGYANLAGDYTIEDVPALLQDPAYIAEILKADFITVGFGNAAFLEDALAKALNGETVEYDWNSLLTETLAPYVLQALAELEAELIAAGLDTDMLGYNLKDMVMTAAEAYLYSAMSYAVYMPAVINAIHEINPEAAVVIVGMYNPMDDVAIDLSMGGNEMTLEFGSYLDDLVEAAMYHGVLYSMITGNSIYVEAPEVETPWTGKTLNIIQDLLMGFDELGENMSPTEAGDEYIKDQILGAVTVTDDSEHKYVLIDSMEPTCEEDGYRVYQCSVCGHTYTETAETNEDLKATGHTGGAFCGGCGQHQCDETNCPSYTFADLAELLEEDPNAWWHVYTDYVIENGLMNGTTTEAPFLFAPTVPPTSRAMVVTVLWRVAGCPDSSVSVEEITETFADVEADQWYTDAVRWAYETGVTQGCGNGLFGTADDVTREQIAVFFYRFTNLATTDADEILSSYPDADEVSEWAKDAMAWAVETDFVRGRVEDGVTYLAPGANTMRIELATWLTRWCAPELEQ